MLFRKGLELDGFPDVENAEHNMSVRGKLAVVKNSR